MSLVRIEKRGKNGGKVVVVICDQCQIECIKNNNQYNRENKFHFCCLKCRCKAQEKGGILDAEKVKRNRELFGVDYPQQLESTKEKVRKTNIERYGAPVSSQNEEVKQKMFKTNYEKYGCKSTAMHESVKKKAAETCVERYGGTGPMTNAEVIKRAQETCMKNHGVPFGIMSEEAREKRKETWKEKYGVEHASQSEIVKEKFKKTCIKKYGVDNPNKCKKIREKTIKTMIERYGVDNPSKSEEIKKKRVETYIERFGVDHPFKNKEVIKKVFETQKRNKSYRTSKPEDSFYEMLCNFFGKEKVERQVYFDKYPIDFYIAEIDLYIQFDGVYWHGLNRPIEEIKNSNTRRDKGIYKVFYSDIIQNYLFKKANKKLVRITDKEFEKAVKDDCFDGIIEKLK